MSLPELTLPSGCPVFTTEGARIELMPRHADVPMASGHGRKRPVFTTAPRVLGVTLLLSVEQMADLDEWFETTLQVGSRPFAAPVAHEGPGLRWWRAEWLTPYVAEPMNGGMWRVTGQLLLTGAPSESPPELGSLRSEITVPVRATAWARSAPQLAVEITVALESVEA